MNMEFKNNWRSDLHGLEYRGLSGHFYIRDSDLIWKDKDEWILGFQKLKMEMDAIKQFSNLYDLRRGR